MCVRAGKFPWKANLGNEDKLQMDWLASLRILFSILLFFMSIDGISFQCGKSEKWEGMS